MLAGLSATVYGALKNWHSKLTQPLELESGSVVGYGIQVQTAVDWVLLPRDQAAFYSASQVSAA